MMIQDGVVVHDNLMVMMCSVMVQTVLANGGGEDVQRVLNLHWSHSAKETLEGGGERGLPLCYGG